MASYSHHPELCAELATEQGPVRVQADGAGLGGATAVIAIIVSVCLPESETQ